MKTGTAGPCSAYTRAHRSISGPVPGSAEVLTLFAAQGWLADSKREKPTTDLLNESLPFMRSTRLMNSIEFGRAVHAEMTAITGARSAESR